MNLYNIYVFFRVTVVYVPVTGGYPIPVQLDPTIVAAIFER